MTDLKRSAIAAALTFTLVSGLAACDTNDDAKPAEAATSVSPSARPSDKEAKNKNTSESDTDKSPAKSKPSASPSPKGPYKPATPKRPAQNVPVPGPLPEVAKEESKAGQVAFIEHWFKEFNYGLETNKLRLEFWEMTNKSCIYCKMVQRVRKMMEKDGSWNIGGELNPKKIQPTLESLDSGVYQIRLIVIENPRKRYFPGNPKPYEEIPGGTVEDAFVELRRVDGQWRVEGIHTIAK
ncbi:DUF6318 family protein [Pseudoglutamicibacter albus]|uniref:DUF6318 domain-containing protein n=1 Tax=Pseudoglutamicibacter albus DNF00011 TaxID=1401063 RepID=A0A095YGQ6_9MICC|nr:DUF6318 family protein [Pseudoglutamicibacter albus]KGF21610.1 hypothetical protein HMPREF2128_00550 [Pseudoglutamicibacter albus DNF00011]